MLEKAREDQSIRVQFMAARSQLIIHVNSGTFVLRLRGTNKTALGQALLDTRQRVLKLIQSQSSNAKSSYSGMTVARYMDVHKKRPEDDGHVVVPIMYEGALTDCVLFRKHAIG